MILKSYHHHRPKLAPSVRVAENAVVIGKVTCGEHVSLWYGAVLRGDTDSIVIGQGCNLQEGAVVHCDVGYPVQVGDHCVIGHGAIIHGCTVGEGSLIGMGATLLSGCQVGKGCIIGANALITGNMVIPDHSLVMGVPGKCIRRVREEELQSILSDCLEYQAMAEEELPLVHQVVPVPLAESTLL